MSYNPPRVGYTSPDEDTVPLNPRTVPLKRLSLPSYAQSTPLPYASPSHYELEKSPFADTVEQEAAVGRRPDGMARRHTQHRKSWEETWDEAVKIGRWPRIIYAGVGVLFVVIWLIVTFGFDRFELAYQTENMNEERESASSSSAGRLKLWLLQGSLKRFDPVSRTLSVIWSPMEIDKGDVKPFGSNADNKWEIGIYRDQSLILETPAHLRLINSINPDFNTYATMRIDNSTAVPIAVVGRHTWDSVTTDIDMGQLMAGHGWLQPSFGYPLDKWTGSIVFAGQFHALARQTNLTTAFGTMIDGAYLVDSILNWRITAETNNTCANLRSDEDVPCHLDVKFIARRPGLVIFCTFIACIVNWASTIFIFIMTCEGVIMRRAKVIEGAQLLGVCFTALFALPSVRAILPGAPDFGCLNLVGIIPNVIIVSLCTTMVAISTLRTMVETQKRRVTMAKYNRMA